MITPELIEAEAEAAKRMRKQRSCQPEYTTPICFASNWMRNWNIEFAKLQAELRLNTIKKLGNKRCKKRK